MFTKHHMPKSDDEYFERMSKVVFMTGLNWRVMEQKWPGIRNTFDGFRINKVAGFLETDVEEIIMNPEVIRSLSKTRAVIANAKEFKNVIKEHGSFKKYLDAVRRRGGEAGLIKDIAERFSYMGRSTAVIFLDSVAEPVPEAAKEWHAMHAA